ncbi:hypothetical protein Ancab_028559 [Ancistrocladus abbreviatus]
MARGDQAPKWHGKAYAQLLGPTAEQVWPLFADFFALNKWYPTPICLPVGGISGQPGCVRYCAGFKTHLHQDDENHVNWTKQKLLSINPDKMTFTYNIIDSNVGFDNYVATVNVLPKDDGCAIEWLYEVDPADGWTLEDLESFTGKVWRVVANRMEDALKEEVKSS